jgi:hypothetical protein
MNLLSILVWGATVVPTTLTIAGQSLGLTRIDIPCILGTMFTANIFGAMLGLLYVPR